MLQYPGGLGIYGAIATIDKQDKNTDTNEYDATFDLEITYTNNTGTDLEWELWMLKSKIEDLSQFTEQNGFSNITTCELKHKTEGTNTYYWYADKGDTSENYNTGERCDAEAIRTAVQGANGELIAYGDLKHGQESQKIDKNTQSTDNSIKYSEEEGTLTSDPLKEAKTKIKQNNLGGRTLNTKDGENSKVYYLVVKYPNAQTDQTSKDSGKDISVKLDVAADSGYTTLAAD